MVETQLRARGIRDARVLRAMATRPASRVRGSALSRPGLRRSSSSHRCRPDHFAAVHRCADAGTSAAGARVEGTGDRNRFGISDRSVWLRLAGHVYSVERHPELARQAAGHAVPAGFDQCDCSWWATAAWDCRNMLPSTPLWCLPRQNKFLRRCLSSCVRAGA